MKYLEFTFTLSPESEAAYDVLADVLAGVGFDSFVHTDRLELPRLTDGRADNPESPLFAQPAAEDAFKAYIPSAQYSAEALAAALADFSLPDVVIRYTQAEAEDKDWNEEWEKNYFQPLVVDGRCVVAGTFHKDVPRAEYQITINPQMSFGTGHHATTSQMISRLLNDEVSGLRVLDMGCGTSILAILARLRGAASCVAIDNDEWCVKNSLENIALNHVDRITVQLGDATSLASLGLFDLIIANINRNILLRDLSSYAAQMASGALIYMSGFYDSDIPAIDTAARACDLTAVDTHVLDGWACVKYRKG